MELNRPSMPGRPRALVCDNIFLLIDFTADKPGRTTMYAGEEYGLELLLNVQREEYILATKTVGFKVI